jgi:hypothetical protein
MDSSLDLPFPRFPSLPFDPSGSSETRGAKRMRQIRLDLTQERNDFENILPEIPPILRR